ncbi:drug/metabolite transporter (DMT)-like permease [Silvibacterium bohemicum]|uniref:Drug/metabolite transporter (DMT)-like permease n=1 Tax=Silvibacterium bohemicum TaxID=1577686 RepID=A0A841JUH7_9BACT|nr:DMT family transporter [Silvibacterium bohemicum]MBB6144810.1 drug/metabolite transporter (DMT)-like permease [Silvibacterium bohemicum]
MSSDHGVRAYAALAVGVIAIAWSAIFVRWTHMPGLASAFYRVFFAAVVLWPLALLSKSPSRRFDMPTLRLAALGGLFFAGDVGTYNIAVLHTTAGAATLLGNNAPVFVGLLTWAITRKSPPRTFWTALAVASIGTMLIMRVDAKRLGLELTGDMLAFCTSICFALYLMVTQRLRDTMDSVALLAMSSTASAITLLPIVLFTHTSFHVPSVASWGAVFGLALVCQVIGYLSLTYALGHLPATITSVLLLAVAPMSAILAFLLFGERMTPLQLLGGALVLLAIWLAGRLRGGARLPAIVE